MLNKNQAKGPTHPRRTVLLGLAAGAAALLSACASSGPLPGEVGQRSANEPPPGPSGLSALGSASVPPTVGSGEVKAALILPFSGSGNAGVVAQSMKNAAEMALAEFQNPNVQLLLKDDGGTVGGAQQAAQQALDEGAEIILGPLFAQAVTAVGQVARSRGKPVIAFSTDSNVATRGVYLLSFLPENEVDRIVEYSISQGRRSFAALIPENPYGNVADGAFRQTVARRGGRIVALERYGSDQAQRQAAIRTVAQAAASAGAIFIPDSGDAVPGVVQGLNAAGAGKVQLLGTGQWEDPRIANDPALQGALYAGPDPAGFRAFADRYRNRYGQNPVPAATLAYDAVALIAALVKTQGQDRFSEQVLTNGSGFNGVDGLFRFRNDGTNQRGLAILRVAPGTPQVVAPPPRAFGRSGT